MSTCDNDAVLSIGASPTNIKWTIVRGDTASFKVMFYEKDEKTLIDTTDWTYASSTYDQKGNAVDALTVNSGLGYAEIVAPSGITETWGTGFKTGFIAELAFDLEITTPDKTWTPIIGTIAVISDISGSGL